MSFPEKGSDFALERPSFIVLGRARLQGPTGTRIEVNRPRIRTTGNLYCAPHETTKTSQGLTCCYRFAQLEKSPHVVPIQMGLINCLGCAGMLGVDWAVSGKSY
jgi:hypothetical protein